MNAVAKVVPIREVNKRTEAVRKPVVVDVPVVRGVSYQCGVCHKRVCQPCARCEDVK